MPRILSDHDVQGQVSRLMDLCQRPPWVDLWRELECVLCTFEEFDLAEDATDATIWHTCQDHDILLITGNRNAAGPASLAMTLRQQNTPQCLPVLTLADPDRILRDPAMQARAAHDHPTRTSPARNGAASGRGQHHGHVWLQRRRKHGFGLRHGYPQGCAARRRSVERDDLQHGPQPG